MTWRGTLLAIAIPMLIQAACLLVLASVDPCNNNPGCMAGNITIFALVLIMPASLLALIIATAIERATNKVSDRTALIVNSILAAIPFVLIFVPVFLYY